MSILIRNVLLHGEHTHIFIQKNRIADIGKIHKADLVIDATDQAVMPTLVNGHTHAAMTLFRGFGDDMPLQEWLEKKIWPAEAKLSEEDVYWGTKLACLEMIKSGTTLFNDMYWHFHGTVRAVEEMGIRAVLSAVLIDFFDTQKARQQQQLNEELWDQSQSYSSRIQFALGPHAIYTVSEDSLQWVAEFSRDKNILVHLHLSETAKEVQECEKQHQLRPVEYLESLSFLGPQLIACHCVYLNNQEWNIIQDKQVNVVHNPVSNLKLAGGRIFSYPASASRNIPVCIGTDGCASNNNLDMLEEIKFASLLQKWNNNDTTLLPCHDLWNMVTKSAHQIFRVDAGTIKAGKLADLMLVNLKHVAMVPCHDHISNLVYACNQSAIDTVICNGKSLMRKRIVEGEEEILAKASEIARKFS